MPYAALARYYDLENADFTEDLDYWLDLAEEHGRLHPDDRERWDAWAAEVAAVIRDRPERGPLEDFQVRLSEAASRRPERA